MIGTASLQALGTGVTVAVTDAKVLRQALAAVESELSCIDLACSRFRDDSELSRLNRHAGDWVAVSPMLMAALDAALRAADLTDGLVDPTIGKALIAAGYDDDFERVAKQGPALEVEVRPAIRAGRIRLDRKTGRAWIARDVSLDLGSTGKALAADRAATAVAAISGAGALVSCGGDLSTAGPAPEGGWSVLVSEHHADVWDGEETVLVKEGGVATSGTVTRRWTRGDRELHHIIDPRTGSPAETPWRVVTVAAATCVDANIASTAAIIMGERAHSWLEEKGLPARLVRRDGTVVRVAGWPA